MKNLRRVDCSLLVVAVIYATAIDIAGLHRWWNVPFAVVLITALYIPSRWTWRLPAMPLCPYCGDWQVAERTRAHHPECETTKKDLR